MSAQSAKANYRIKVAYRVKLINEGGSNELTAEGVLKITPDKNTRKYLF